MRQVLTALALCTVLQAHAEFIDERAPVQPLAPAAAASSVVAARVAAPPAPAPASLELRKGKPVFDQLRAYGKETGWDLVWEAPVYVVDRDMVVPGDFEAAVADFLKGANEAGTRMRAVFYRGNKTVRISEF